MEQECFTNEIENLGVILEIGICNLFVIWGLFFVILSLCIAA